MSIVPKSKSDFISKPTKSLTRVGQDVLSYCSRCKLNLSHIILTITPAQKADKVQCSTCKSEKRYRKPKSNEEIAGENGGPMDGEEELDLEAGAKKLAMNADNRKKSKLKSKLKKKAEDHGRPATSKSQNGLPLSMLNGTNEDKAQFEARMSSLKNNLANAKEYKPSIRFKVGEVIKHKSFGVGFVVSESGAIKVEVLFSEGRKLLVSGLGS